MNIPTSSSNLRTPLRVIAAAVTLTLVGCAAIENAKGRAQYRFNEPDDAIHSFERATKLAPTNPEYKVDYLLTRQRIVDEAVLIADAQRDDGKLAEAQAGYERVLELDRGNQRARAALNAMPIHLRNAKLLADGEALLAQGKVDVVLDRANQVLELNPQNKRALKLKEAALDSKTALESERDQASGIKSILGKSVTLQFNDVPIRQVFEALSKASGLNVLIDRDVRATAKATIFVNNIAVGDAIDFVLMQNQLERRAINGNTVIVFPSTDAKRGEYEDLVIRSFQITNADLRYLSSMLKTMLRLKEVAADERSGVLVIRDTPERLRMAARLIAIHDLPDPEVMLEVEILEVTTTRQSNIGIQPPTGITITTPSAAATLGALKQLRSNDLLVTPLATTINFKLEDGDARLLASPRVRARNREKARIMIGDRVPTITNSVTPLTTGNAVVTGNVTYQDVGLKLEIEPSVHSGSEVGIKVALEVSNIVAEFTDAQGGRSYQIGTRNATTNLRLNDGETQILGGLITDQDRNTASKIPGLGHLPVVGRIFGNNQGSETRSEIILAITPRIVRNLPLQGPDARGIFSGTMSSIREAPLLAEPVNTGGKVQLIGDGAASTPAIPAQPAIQQQQGGGVLFNPSSSGQQAAPAGGSPPANQPVLPAPPPMYVRPTPAR